jgi:predicted aspartyl protease
MHLDEFKERNHGQCLQDGGAGICFVNAMVSGVKVAALVDTNVTHSFVTERTATSLHCNPKTSMVTFNVVNSAVKPMVGVVRSAPLRVEIYFGSLDLTLVQLDDHAMILG